MSVGRRRKLTPEQERRIYAELSPLRYGQHFRALSRLARELGVSVPTVERALTRQRRERIADVFHDYIKTPVPHAA
jgi:DNA-binding transcriptional regulator LsrR (DeoR family)